MAQAQRDVFINCPFDDDYRPFFYAITYAVIRSGFIPRSALESDDGTEVRLLKIQDIIEECRYGIHDLSRTELTGDPPLPRFNMPLELGLFLGAKRFGDATQKTKRALILDVNQRRYDQFISDIAGQDIHDHGGLPDGAIVEVATWLRQQSKDTKVPGGRQIVQDFEHFQADLPSILADRQLGDDEVTFGDFVSIATAYADAVS